MASREPIYSSFNAGELSPRLGGRPDLAAYANGVAEMLNVVPLVQGPATKRSGTRFVALTRDQSDPARLIPFTPQLTQGYIIEATDFTFRFYTNNVQVAAGGAPIELATPWSTADVARLNWQQSNDVMYFVDGKRAPRRFSRTGGTSFSLATLALKNGPFKDLNTDETLKVQASAQTGSVTLTATSAIFQAGHVGGLFYLEIEDFRTVPAWEAGIEVSLGQFRRSEGKIYSAIQLPSDNKRTGSIIPSHVRGAEWDGMASGGDVNNHGAGGVLWQYETGKYGVLQITAVASGTSATATVVTKLPTTVVSAPSWRWALGAFSDAEGWPSVVTIWNQRLVLAKGNSVYASVVGDLSNFSPRNDAGELTADRALQYSLDGGDAIVWMAADRQLLVGTTSTEYAIGGVNQQLAASSTNIGAPIQSRYGSARVRPIAAGSQTMFVQRAGRKVRVMGYQYNVDRYTATDETVRAEHITRGGIVELALQQEPESLIWAARADGALLSFTNSTEQDVHGWSRHMLGGGGAVEGIAVIPSIDGSADDLWLSVSRSIDGSPLRTIERLEEFWEDGQDQALGFFVDCGLSYNGPAAGTFGDLDHLIGSTDRRAGRRRDPPAADGRPDRVGDAGQRRQGLDRPHRPALHRAADDDEARGGRLWRHRAGQDQADRLADRAHARHARPACRGARRHPRRGQHARPADADGKAAGSQ